MIKTITMLKRRSGMTPEEFREYYETTHRLIGEKYLKGNVEHYGRRFITGPTNPDTGTAGEPDFDVMLEIWYSDAAQQAATRKILLAPEAMQEIREDEAKLFDPSTRIHYTVVEEHVSDVT